MSEQHEHQLQRANPNAPVPNIVSYVPKQGKEAELLALVKKHEPALRKVGLVTSEPFRLWKAYDIRKKREQYIEYFVWKDGAASNVAHQTPEIMAVWEPTGPVLEELTICEVEQL
ncbi:MAG TPA: hypothetical protein VHM25_03310 [Polyangiaceae bacterium]|jgi:hypothetical protein|nr:hypothetical protein [Polyangiaceae bacterium]